MKVETSLHLVCLKCYVPIVIVWDCYTGTAGQHSSKSEEDYYCFHKPLYELSFNLRISNVLRVVVNILFAHWAFNTILIWAY